MNNIFLDERTADWHLVYSPWIPIITVILYAVFCIYSRKITQLLPSYDLKGVILVYNFLMTVLSMYMTKEVSYIYSLPYVQQSKHSVVTVFLCSMERELWMFMSAS